MEEVEYRLILRDEFSKAMAGAKQHADHLENSFSKLKETAIHMAEAFAVFEIGKESLQAYEESEKANAQLQASLESTGYAAGLSAEQLKKQGEELNKNSLFADELETKMQSVLLTFTNIKGDIFKTASQAINDMSAKMGTDLQSTAIQVGKALQDPITGISALHRVGVNFSAAQKEVIKSLVETGRTAEAQRLILKELNTEFGGSAAAAMSAAPIENMKKEWEEVLETIGGALQSVLVEVMPFVRSIFEGLKNIIDFLQQHTSAVKAFGIAIGAIGAAMAYSSIQSAFLATGFGSVAASMGIAAAAEASFESAQLALNAAMEANPIGVVLVALGAMAAAIELVIGNYEKLRAVYLNEDKKGKEQGKSEALADLEKQVELLQLKKHLTKEQAEQEALVAANKKYDEGINTYFEKIQKVKAKIDENVKTFDSGDRSTIHQDMGELHGQLDAFTIKMDAFKAAKKAINEGGVFDKMKTGKAGVDGITPKTQKISGNNHTIINVNIAKLVETLKIESQNIKDGATMGAEHVTRALIASVNQFQASIDT